MVIIVVFLIFLIFFIVFTSLKNNILFDPSKELIWHPNNDIFFNNLHGWYFPGDESKPCILYCHGNSGNISHRKAIVDLCQEVNISLFLFDYRGYGLSQGTPSLRGICQDGEYAYQTLKNLTQQKIILWGESIGGCVAIHLATKYPCYRLLLLSTFVDLATLAWEKGGVLGKVAYPFLDFSNRKKISSVNIPVLIAHSKEDTLIPYSHAERLYEAIPHPWKKLVTIKGDHGSPEINEEIIKEFLRFSWLPPTI